MTKPKGHCEKCRYWDSGSWDNEDEGGCKVRGEWGLCRRRSVVPARLLAETGIDGDWWPETALDDWCGEFEPSPQKCKTPEWL